MILPRLNLIPRELTQFLSIVGCTCILTVSAKAEAPAPRVTASAAPAPLVDSDGSIQWDDLHYQTKPDGAPMYLVSLQGVLIEGSKFTIKDPNGATHSNLLPWEIRQRVTSAGLVIDEPIKIQAATGRYRVETALECDRKLNCLIDFTAEGYTADSLTFNLPLETYASQQFVVDGELFDYGSLKVAQDARRRVLLPRRAFNEFSSMPSGGLAFTMQSHSELEVEVISSVDWKGHRSYWVSFYPADGQIIDYTLKMPAYDASAVAAFDAERPQNILANSSFELGREEWGVIFGKRDVSSTWIVSDGDASHGAHALQVNIVPQVAPYESAHKGATIASDYFQGRPLERLTVSADLKGTVSGQEVQLQLRYVPVALVPNRGSNLIEKTVTLSNEWARYSFDVRLPMAAKNAYAIAIEIPQTTEAATVHLDAVTVTAAGHSEYQPKADLEVLSDTVRYRRLYEPGETFDLVTTIRNDGASSAPAVARITLSDTNGALLFKSEQSVDVAAGANQVVRWDIPPFEKQGMYRVTVESGASYSEFVQHQTLSLAVLRGRDVDGADPSNKFGVNITDLREFWALERLGMGWSRFTFDCGLGLLMPQKGQWNQAHADKLSALLDYQASFGVSPLAVLGPGMPKWASRAPEGSSVFRAYTPTDDAEPYFVDYLNRLMEMADGRLYAIETWNEPDIPLFYRGTVQEMADFTTLAYDTIKAKNPEIEVVGLGLATPAETYNRFLRKVLEQTGVAPYDAISYHPYTEGRRHPARGEFREVVQGIHGVIAEFGKVPPLWATEFGYFGLGADAKPFVPFKNPFVAREILDEAESAAAYIQAICTAFANGVEKTFYFTLLEGNLLDRWLQGWVGPGGRSVESGFVAAATACDLMNGADCLGQSELTDGIWQTQFSRGGTRDFVVLWSETGAHTIELKTNSKVYGCDLFGNRFELHPQSGVIRFSVGPTPLYLVLSNLTEYL